MPRHHVPPEVPAGSPEMVVQRDPAEYEEPTWEVRQPDARRRFRGRTRSILLIAVVATIVVNAGAAWAYWTVSRSQTASAWAGRVVELPLHGRSDLSRPLAPGSTGDLSVTLVNDHDFPIRITSVTPGLGTIVADDEHRHAGCLESGVSMTKGQFAVSWNVARNTIGAFTLPGGLRMSAHSRQACAGATFTVPVQTTGVSGRW